jgi:hypothetical protein
VRAHRATQLTSDHSLVAQLVARQQLTGREARHDPRRNVVTRSVGVAPDVDVDLVTLAEPLQNGDTLVLCSDGLHGQVSDDEIAGRRHGRVDRGRLPRTHRPGQRARWPGQHHRGDAALRAARRLVDERWTRFWRALFGKRTS